MTISAVPVDLVCILARAKHKTVDKEDDDPEVEIRVDCQNQVREARPHEHVELVDARDISINDVRVWHRVLSVVELRDQSAQEKREHAAENRCNHD